MEWIYLATLSNLLSNRLLPYLWFSGSCQVVYSSSLAPDKVYCGEDPANQNFIIPFAGQPDHVIGWLIFPQIVYCQLITTAAIPFKEKHHCCPSSGSRLKSPDSMMMWNLSCVLTLSRIRDSSIPVLECVCSLSCTAIWHTRAWPTPCLCHQEPFACKPLRRPASVARRGLYHSSASNRVTLSLRFPHLPPQRAALFWSMYTEGWHFPDVFASGNRVFIDQKLTPASPHPSEMAPDLSCSWLMYKLMNSPKGHLTAMASPQEWVRIS